MSIFDINWEDEYCSGRRRNLSHSGLICMKCYNLLNLYMYNTCISLISKIGCSLHNCVTVIHISVLVFTNKILFIFQSQGICEGEGHCAR